jgi:triosephosphate isomerase
MKKIYIVANWKSNNSESEARKWLQECQIFSDKFQMANKEVVICPSFTLLKLCKQKIEESKLDLQLGAQDVSPFPLGAYTGEIAAAQLKELVRYIIIGHSERRRYFHEDEAMLINKVEMALEQEITPIFCISDAYDSIPKGVEIVAYEPVFAIGTGEPDTPKHAEEVAHTIKERNATVQVVLYGGSVDKGNIKNFIQEEHIDGVLVGSASLSADSFLQLVSAVSL